MRLLLDTHAYFWWARGYDKLSRQAASRLSEPDTEVVISAVVPWELATKNRSGKWPDAEVVLHDLETGIARRGWKALPISLEHARLAGSLTSPHKDPFDRLLAAQAILDGLTLVTADPAFQTFPCRTLW